MPPGTTKDLQSRVFWTNLIQRWYHIPVLSLILVYMLSVRLIPFNALVRSDDVYFLGNDAYYHFRQTNYAIQNWPFTMPFEVWSSFPSGTYVGQFGTLFDQIIAIAALLVGLGDPTQRQIAVVFIVAPAVFGVLCGIPTYLIGKQLGDRLTGLIAVGVLAILPGVFLSRSVVGFTDHHVAEVLFHSASVLVLIIALSVAEREKPVYEQFIDRDWNGLRNPIKWSVLAGVMISFYIWVWPPGIVIVGISGVFFSIKLPVDYFRNRSPEHTATVGVITFVVVGLLTAITVDQFSIGGPNSHNLLHPILAISVALGCIFLAWFARFFEKRELDPRGYPASVALLIVFGGFIFSILSPEIFGTLINNLFRTIALGQSDTAFTIGEAQSTFAQPAGASQYFFGSYGFTHITALAGLIWLAVRTYSYEKNRTQNSFVILWSVFIVFMALTQVRFHYYLAIVVAVLNAYFVIRVLRLLDFPSMPELFDGSKNLGVYRVLTLLVIALVIAAPLLAPVGPLSPQDQAARQTAGAVTVWSEGAEWLSENTPHPGTFGGAENSMQYYGAYERTDDFVYPKGAYGVMSWWDYGHWITVIGERIPHANPFQQGARPSSAYLQAQTEERANLLLDAIPSTNNPYRLTDAELRDLISEQSPDEANERIRYVMIDDEMAAEKFPAIATWTGPGTSEYVGNEQFLVGQQNETLPTRNDRYDESMLAKLYVDDASGLDHYRLIHETDRYSIVGSVFARAGAETQVQVFTSIRIGGWEEQAGSISNQLTSVRQQGQAARIGNNQYVYDANVLSSVKTFERVNGATIRGETSNTDQITAYVELEVTNTGRTFFYSQTVTPEADGTFEITVPYATESYLGPSDGYTNTSVRALGNYTVISGHPLAPSEAGHVDVPDRAVVNGETLSIELEATDSGSGTEPDNSTVTNESRVTPIAVSQSTR